MSKVVNMDMARRRAHESGSKYDPQEFVVPARDTKGHADRFNLNIQPGHLRALEVVASSKAFPFKDKSDVARWCIARGLAILDQLEPVEMHLRQTDAIIATVRTAELLQNFKQTFAETERVVMGLLAEGDDGLARQLIAEVKAQIRSMPDDLWRAKYEAEFERRLGHYEDAPDRKKKRK